MSGIFDRFSEAIYRSVSQRHQTAVDTSAANFDDKIALGVLLWFVASADNKFLPQEKEKIKEILSSSGGISDEHLPYVLESIESAAKESIDLYSFTHEVSEGMSFDIRQAIVENLFRVACADNDLAQEEHEIIRKISGLLKMEHKEFIDAKIKIKKEFGMDTAGL